MTDELRDVQAIRADLVAWNGATTDLAVVGEAGLRLAADVEPLLAALADRDAKLAAALDLCSRYSPDQLRLRVDAFVGDLRAALSLSVPTSRTCSAGIGGGETCDLPDGHEGPHSSDGIPVPTSPQMCEHSGPSLARDGLVASPVDRCEQCGDDRATSAGPNCTEPNDHYPSGRSPSPKRRPTLNPLAVQQRQRATRELVPEQQKEQK